MTARPTGQGSPAELAAIRTEDLRKTYKSSRGDVEAVRGIDLDVPQGEFFGLLGPNGAGKSTTMRVVLGLDEERGDSLVIETQRRSHINQSPGDVSANGR